MPETQTTRTIIVVKLPDSSRELIAAGDLAGLKPQFFGAEEQEAMEEVSHFVEQLSDVQAELLLTGLQHGLEEEHDARVHFVEYKSGYEMEGIGLELKDDSVTEEMMSGPIRVMFVRWDIVTS